MRKGQFPEHILFQMFRLPFKKRTLKFCLLILLACVISYSALTCFQFSCEPLKKLQFFWKDAIYGRYEHQENSVHGRKYRHGNNNKLVSEHESKSDTIQALNMYKVGIRMEDKIQGSLYVRGNNIGTNSMTVSSAAGREWKAPPNAGEQGVGVEVDKAQLSAAQRQRMEEGQRQHAFNEFVSSLISLQRTLPPGPNEQQCRSISYKVNLPEASVVIVFHNEAWSTLLRTVHSVLDRSPPHLLRQVILVDDFSQLEHLKKPLEDYLKLVTKVTVVRATSRVGLIRARLLGLSYVNASVIVYLDSHCECAEGWLEPLLARIAENSTRVVAPTIQNIDPRTFRYSQNLPEQVYVGTFNWKLQFEWTVIQPHEKLRRKLSTEPVRTPTMAGGLFAIDRDYFCKLGTYDSGMKIWGGENLELSFKIWMCGGTLEIMPCSNVGHVFRSRGFKSYADNIAVNLARLATVWLDDYIFYYHQAEPGRQFVDPGDVTERKELCRRLNCHSFAWLLRHVMPEKRLPADKTLCRPIFNTYFNSCVARRGRSLHVTLASCNYTKPVISATGWCWDTEEGVIYYKDACLAGTHCLAWLCKNVRGKTEARAGNTLRCSWLESRR